MGCHPNPIDKTTNQRRIGSPGMVAIMGPWLGLGQGKKGISWEDVWLGVQQILNHG